MMTLLMILAGILCVIVALICIVIPVVMIVLGIGAEVAIDVGVLWLIWLGIKALTGM